MLATLALLPFVHADAAWFDSGHLTAAAAGLGVPHPTGFPLFCILGYGAHLIPIGTLPFKVALLSALCTAGAAALVYRTLVRQGAARWMAAAGAVSLVLNFVVFLNATLAEVYAVSLFWLAGLFALLAQPQPRWAMAGFWTGMGFGAHVTFWLFAGLLWVATALRGMRFRELGMAVPWGIWGALVIAYLPLAALRDPILNWGDPSDFTGLIDHLSAASIRSSFADDMLTGAGWGEHALSWLDAAAGPLWPLWLVLLGVGWWAADLREVWIAGLILLGVDLLYATLINPMGLDELQNGTPGALALAFLAPVGLAGLKEKVGNAAAFGGVAIMTVAIATSLVPTLSQRPPDDLAGRYARLALAEPLPGSLLVTSTDHLSGQSIYLQGLEGFRTDVEAIVAQHHEDPSLLAARAVPERPAFWQLGDSYSDRGVRGHLTPTGWLYRVSATEVARPAAVATAYSNDVARWSQYGSGLNFRSKRAFSNEARLRATFHMLLGDTASGLGFGKIAVELDPDNEKALLTLAVALARSGRVPDAVKLLERAVEIAPRYAMAWKNLAAFREVAGDTGGATEARTRFEALMGSPR